MGRIKEWVADLLRSTIKDPNQRIGIAAALGLFSFVEDVEEPTKPWRPEPNLIIPVAVAISALSSPQISQQVENQLSPISSPENQSTLWPLATNLTLGKLREIVNEQYIGKNLSDHFDPSKIVPRLYHPDSPFYSLHLPEVKAGEPLNKFEYPQSPNTIATVFVSSEEKKPTLYFFPSLVIFNTQLTPSINPKGELTYIDPANQLRIIIPQEVLEKIGPDDIGLSEYVHSQLESLINQGKYVLVNHQTSSIRRWEVNKPVGDLGMDLNLRYEENGNLIITVGPQVIEIEKSKIPPFLANLNSEGITFVDEQFDNKERKLTFSDGQSNFTLILDENNTPLKIVGPPTERQFAEINASSLNVRRSPGTKGEKIGAVRKGTRLEIIDSTPIEVEGINWVKVRLPDGTEGYIAWGEQYSQIKTEKITPELVIPPSEELIIPAPDFESLEIKRAIDDFINAMKMGGIEATEKEVAGKITYIDKKSDGTPLVDQNGKPFIVGVYNLDPDPLKKGETHEGSIPLIIWTREGGWRKATFRDFYTIGTSVDGAEKDETQIYKETVGENFALIFPSGSFMQTTIDRWDYIFANNFRNLADTYKQIFYIHPGFWHGDLSKRINNLEGENLKNFMRQRVRNLLRYVNKINPGEAPTYINIINEPLYSWGGKPGWEKSPYFKLFGEDLITEVYMMFYEEAKNLGLEVGKDVRFVYSDYDLYRNSDKSRFVFNELQRSRDEIAKRLGINPRDVQLDISMQMRLDYNSGDPSKNGGRYPVPTKEELREAILRFSNLFPRGQIHITEFSIINAPPSQQGEILARLSVTALATGKVKSITFEAPLRFFDDGATSSKYTGIFLEAGNYIRPTGNYYLILSRLFNLFLQQN